MMPKKIEIEEGFMMKIIASKKKIKPGIYDISIEDYHRGPGISRSGLMEFKRSPYHYWYKYLNPDYKPEPPTPAYILGNAFHTYVLEPHKFDKRYFVMPELNKATKEGKARWQKIQSELGQRKILSMSHYQIMQRMAESFQKHELASQFLEKANVEQSIYWIDPETNILCKCRPDILRPNLIADLKTTINGSAKAFSKAIYDYGYHIQAAMIQGALLEIKKVKLNDFLFLVIEKSAPYAISIYQLDQASIEQGRQEFKQLLSRYKHCLETNAWPAYAIQTISIPLYGFQQLSGEYYVQ